MKRILCMFGFHDWSKWVLADGKRRVLWFPEERCTLQARICHRCNRHQLKEI